MAIGLATVAYYFLVLPLLIFLLVLTDGESVLSHLLGIPIDPETALRSILLLTLIAPIANLVGMALAAPSLASRTAKVAFAVNAAMLLLLFLVLALDRLG